MLNLSRMLGHGGGSVYALGVGESVFDLAAMPQDMMAQVGESRLLGYVVKALELGAVVRIDNDPEVAD